MNYGVRVFFLFMHTVCTPLTCLTISGDTAFRCTKLGNRRIKWITFKAFISRGAILTQRYIRLELIASNTLSINSLTNFLTTWDVATSLISISIWHILTFITSAYSHFSRCHSVFAVAPIIYCFCSICTFCLIALLLLLNFLFLLQLCFNVIYSFTSCVTLLIIWLCKIVLILMSRALPSWSVIVKADWSFSMLIKLQAWATLRYVSRCDFWFWTWVIILVAVTGTTTFLTFRTTLTRWVCVNSTLHVTRSAKHVFLQIIR